MAGSWTVARDVVVDNVRVSASSLNERSDDVAALLQGVARVAVVARPTIETIATILGALRAGAVVVPMSSDSGDVERGHVLRDSGADVLVDGPSTSPLASATPPACPPGTALLMYTSGTTGAPKGVPITSDAIASCLDSLADAWAWTPDDTLVHGLPLHHVHGLVLGALGPIHVGSQLVHTGRPTPAAYAAALGTLYFGVPTVWSRVAADPTAARALSHARLLVSGSAALPPAVFDALGHQCGQAPVERYGMTETLITVSARADEPRIVGTVGRPLAGTTTRVIDESGGEAPRGAVGELQVRGPTVFSGYLGRPDATAAAFTADGWFHTGDAAVIDGTGIHRLIGRMSTDLIKSGGYRIGAGEIEDSLMSFPGVSEAAVVGVDDDDLGQRIVAFVVSTPIEAGRLIEHVASELSWHKRPREIVFVEALPRNAMGKIEKTALRDAYDGSG